MSAPTLVDQLKRKRVLVCGGRRYGRGGFVVSVLDAMRPVEVIHGACPTGADAHADAWAKARGVPVRAFPADWTAHGRAAGPIRNQRMIDEGRPDYVIAFAGERGTADMVSRAKKAGIEVIEGPCVEVL